jgi:hypothetical protein
MVVETKSRLTDAVRISVKNISIAEPLSSEGKEDERFRVE